MKISEHPNRFNYQPLEIPSLNRGTRGTTENHQLFIFGGLSVINSEASLELKRYKVIAMRLVFKFEESKCVLAFQIPNVEM